MVKRDILTVRLGFGGLAVQMQTEISAPSQRQETGGFLPGASSPMLLAACFDRVMDGKFAPFHQNEAFRLGSLRILFTSCKARKPEIFLVADAYEDRRAERWAAITGSSRSLNAPASTVRVGFAAVHRPP